jgi:uncharacterized protein (TIGR03000 family)
MSRRTFASLGLLLGAGVLALAATPAAEAHGGGGHGGGGFHGGGFHGGGFHEGLGGFHGGLGGFHGGYGGFGRGFGGFYPGFFGGLGLGYGLGYGGLGWYRPYYGYGGLGYGYGYPGYGDYSDYYSGYYAPPTTTTVTVEPSEEQADNAAHLQLIVPSDALVWFDGDKTTQTGPEREYVSPPLPPGKKFTYDVRVKYLKPDGQVVDETRPIHVRANDWWTVDFTRPAPKRPAGAPQKPESKPPAQAPAPTPEPKR